MPFPDDVPGVMAAASMLGSPRRAHDVGDSMSNEGEVSSFLSLI